MGDYYYIMGIRPHVLACTKELYGYSNDTGSEEWLFITNEILYYLYPAIIALALIFTLLNSIVSAKMVTDSHECYLTGFNISSFVLVLISAVIHIPGYTPVGEHEGFYETFRLMLPYLTAVENQCFYTCAWLLVTAVTERMGHAMCGKWHSSFGRVHGILASLMIVIVCFVFTLPQYWEYKTVFVSDNPSGRTCDRLVIAPSDAVVEAEGGYVTPYQYYRWFLMAFSIGLPYLTLPIMLAPICCVKTHNYTKVSGNGHVSTYATDEYTTKDYVKDDKSFNRLLAVTVMIFLILSGPRNLVKLLHDPPFFLTFCDSKLMSDTLSILFDICFYFMFFSLFFFNICCSAKFRRNLKSLRNCCCCCKGQAEDN